MTQLLGTLITKKVAIANGASLSNVAADLSGYALVAIVQPAATEGVRWQFQADPGDGTFYIVNSSDGAHLKVTKSATVAEWTNLAAPYLRAALLKIQSEDGAGNAVNQTGAVDVLLVFAAVPVE